MLLMFVLLVLIAIAADVYYETHVPKANKVRLSTTCIPQGKGFRILQITDLHDVKFPDGDRAFLELVRVQEADLIVLTGDLIDRHTKDLQHTLRRIDRLMALHLHIYYVTGNHEWDNRRLPELLAGLGQRGVQLLRNAHTLFAKGDIALNLVGVDDPSTRRDRLQQAFQGIADRGLFTVLLAHDPMIVKRPEPIPADLILSGHTHGGQIRLPLIGAIIAPGQGMFPELDKGVFRLSDHRVLHIDSGLGTAWWPIRFCNRSQITLLDVQGEG